MREKELVEYIAKSLVDEPEQVVVDETVNETGLHLELRVSQQDMGKVIGREGRIVKAMRTILKVMGAREGRSVNLKIV
jgi:hypothetical protein